MSRTNPIKWAKALTKVHGLSNDNPDNPGAIELTDKYAKPFIGLDNNTPNPHYNFYIEALNWLKKQR